MPATVTLQRRLIRTKEAATYLSMSDWKLRRLIQEGAFPVVQEPDTHTAALRCMERFE